jgi:hypothetical protein
VPKISNQGPKTIRNANVDQAGPTTKADAAQQSKASADQAATFGGAGNLSPTDVQAQGTPGAAMAARLEAMGLSKDDAAGLRPGVAELMAKYGVEERMGRPRERVLTWTAFIDERLQGTDSPTALADKIVDKDLRRQLFLLEGICKLYKNEYPEMRGQRDSVKQLEDVIGHFTGARAQYEVLKDNPNVPDDAKAYLKKHMDEKHEILTQVVAEKWFPGPDGKVPGIQELVSTLEGIDWASEKKDLKFIADELRDELKDIRDTEYDMADLQGEVGMHELRRDLRWFPIYVEALDGLVQLSADQNPSDFHKKWLDDDLSKSKYVGLPEPGLDKKTITLSLSLYTANMAEVLGFGKLKDSREEIEGLQHALVGLGKAEAGEAAEDMASKMLGRPVTADETMTEAAIERYNSLVEHELIQHMRKELKPYEK